MTRRILLAVLAATLLSAPQPFAGTWSGAPDAIGQVTPAEALAAPLAWPRFDPGDGAPLPVPTPFSGAGEPIPAQAIGTPLNGYRGTASWYCSATSACTKGYRPSDMVAAIDPKLGIAKGTWITVSHDGASIRVRVVDVCLCKGPRLVDLTSGAFSRLAPLSAGRIPVTIVVEGPKPTAPKPTAPPTDVEAP